MKFDLRIGSQKRLCDYLNNRAEEITRDLQSLVEIPSVRSEPEDGMPFGRECAMVLEKALEIARREGLEVENCGNWYGLARWGTGEQHIGIFSHLDVVSAGADWIYEPFSCTEEDGWLIGRGVGDDKTAAVLGIYTLCALRDLGLSTDTKYTVFFGCNEESGMEDIKKYTAEQNEPDFSLVPDIRFPVCIGERGIIKTSVERESGGGGTLISFCGGERSSKVPARCESTLGLSAEQRLAIADMARTEDRVEVTETDEGVKVMAFGRASSVSGAEKGISAIGILSDFLLRSGVLQDSEIRAMEELRDVGASWKGEHMGLAYSDKSSGPLKSVCTFAELRDDKWELDFDMRYPITLDSDEINAAIKRYFDDNNWRITKSTHSLPRNTTGFDGEIAVLCRSWTEISGREGEPFVIGGGTYARKLKNAVGYGPDNGGQCPFLPDGHGGIHGPDEARSIRSVEEAFATYILGCSELSKYMAKNKHKVLEKSVMRENISTCAAPAAIGPYSQAVALDTLVITSGQLPIAPDTGAFPSDDVKEQTRQSLQNVRAVLEAAGSGMDKVIKTTVFLTDIADFAAMNEVYASFFTEGNYPARSAVQVAALPKNAKVEIEVTAHR